MLLPLVGAGEHGACILQHDATNFSLLRHGQISAAIGKKAFPWIVMASQHKLQSLVHFFIHLGHHGSQQAGLATKVVIERAARQTGLRGQLVHGGLGVAMLGESAARSTDQLGPRGFDHAGTTLANLGHCELPAIFTYKAYANHTRYIPSS